MRKFILPLLLGLAIFPAAIFAKFPFIDNVNEAATDIANQSTRLNPKVVKLALMAYNCAISKGVAINKMYLTIVDYSLPDNEKRLWVVNLQDKKVLLNIYVAQGKHTGLIYAKHFSNVPGTLESSLGLYLTGGTFVGNDGLSMRVYGLDKGFNNNAFRREIVMHGAWYVSQAFVNEYGRVGRSWGCFALDKTMIRPVTSLIKNGSLLFAYFPEQAWLNDSIYLHCPAAMGK